MKLFFYVCLFLLSIMMCHFPVSFSFLFLPLYFGNRTCHFAFKMGMRKNCGLLCVGSVACTINRVSCSSSISGF